VVEAVDVRVEREAVRPGIVAALSLCNVWSGVGVDRTFGVDVGCARPSLFTSTVIRIGTIPRRGSTRDRDPTRQLRHRLVSALTSAIIVKFEASSLQHFSAKMFRTAARGFAASAWRTAESIGQIEAAQQTAINISKAQGIGQRGFIDGKTHIIYLQSSPY
jgi:hypothetical protein